MPDTPFKPDAETVARIVAWLRAQAARKARDASRIAGTDKGFYWRGMEGAYTLGADAIERGEAFK